MINEFADVNLKTALFLLLPDSGSTAAAPFTETFTFFSVVLLPVGWKKVKEKNCEINTM